MKATKANLKRCGAGTVMFCTKCYAQYSAHAGDYWDHPDDYIFKCDGCGLEMELGSVTKIFIPASPRVICVIHDQGDYISTWLVEVEPDKDSLDAIHDELFPGDEDWPTLKKSIEWFYLDPIAAMTLKDIEWPSIDCDSQHTEQHLARAAIYRAFKVGGAEEEDPEESQG